LYFDGNLYRSIYFLNWTKLDKKRGYKGDFISVERLKTPSVFVFWIKKYLGNNGNLPDGTKSLEADYFHYYKPKPILKAASYSYNYLTLSAASFVPDETYNWTVNSGNLSLVTQNTGTALFSVPSGFLSSTISVSGTGGYPTATATNSFEVKSSNGNFCTLNGLGNLPVIYIANDFYAPQAGCSSTVIPTGKEVIFVGNSITLNPGFEVQLGATFSAF
ncbi:MAG: hypothetical protein KBG11_09910, partial [Bacteroidia bacterium]|nr:hypothetical protein [Bacteroidia bacterium]